MDSIWIEGTKLKHDITLQGDVNKNIVIVGGGIAGFLTAFRIAKSGQDVTLIEANTLFSGVTRGTTAHIEALQGYIYTKLSKTSFARAKNFFDSQIDAISEYEALIKEYNIDCDFERLDSYLFSPNNLSDLIKEYEILSYMGAEVELVDTAKILDYKIDGAIKLANQAIFEPIKFLNGLPINFEVIEHTRVKKVDIKKKLLYTEKALIKANKIIIATNFPIIDSSGWYFMKMYKSHSYTVAIDKGNNLNGMYQSDEENGLTFRNQKDYVIVGGLDHRSGRIDKENKFDRLYQNGLHLSQGGKCKFRWSANDCITFDNLPYIGYYNSKSKDVFVITGFNKWGMANSMISSILIKDMIIGNKNKYQHLFSPQRTRMPSITCVKNLLAVTKNLIIMPLTIPMKCAKSLNNDEGAIVLYKGLKKAVYKDCDGNLHICQAFCSHLGCQLKFNYETKTWDCPCHGSRYDIDGNIITAPAVDRLKNTNV